MRNSGGSPQLQPLLRQQKNEKITRLREYTLSHTEILMQLEKEVKGNSRDIENIFTVLRELIGQQSTPKPRNRIGFKI